MAIEIKAPVFPESVADGTIAVWHKKPGDKVSRDDVLVDIETDKVVLEVVAPSDGVMSSLIKNEGDIVLSNEVIGIFDESGAGGSQSAAANAPQATSPASVTSNPAAASTATTSTDRSLDQSPAVRKALAETGVNPTDVNGTGRDGRLTKADVAAHIANPTPVAAATSTATVSPTTVLPTDGNAISTSFDDRVERRVPMTRLRAKVAERLLMATQQTAMLTTFNEVNMKPLMDMRKTYQERFEKRHGVKLGFMSLFVRAATEALKRFPAINASIDGADIVYHGYYDIGVAVSSDRGLVVPVLRDTDRMNLAEVEKNIIGYGKKAREGKLGMDDLSGGTFTISNGGVFGSLLSTPIINPPQTAILGMHKIQDRPMAVNGQVVILPMMYLALSYDHRLVDGKEAVSFLVTIKELVEDPSLLLLDL